MTQYRGDDMNVQKFFDTLGALYGKKEGVKVKYTIQKK